MLLARKLWVLAFFFQWIASTSFAGLNDLLDEYGQIRQDCGVLKGLAIGVRSVSWKSYEDSSEYLVPSSQAAAQSSSLSSAPSSLPVLPKSKEDDQNRNLISMQARGDLAASCVETKSSIRRAIETITDESLKSELDRISMHLDLVTKLPVGNFGYDVWNTQVVLMRELFSATARNIDSLVEGCLKNKAGKKQDILELIAKSPQALDEDAGRRLQALHIQIQDTETRLQHLKEKEAHQVQVMREMDQKVERLSEAAEQCEIRLRDQERVFQEKSKKIAELTAECQRLDQARAEREKALEQLYASHLAKVIEQRNATKKQVFLVGFDDAKYGPLIKVVEASMQEFFENLAHEYRHKPSLSITGKLLTFRKKTSVLAGGEWDLSLLLSLDVYTDFDRKVVRKLIPELVFDSQGHLKMKACQAGCATLTAAILQSAPELAKAISQLEQAGRPLNNEAVMQTQIDFQSRFPSQSSSAPLPSAPLSEVEGEPGNSALFNVNTTSSIFLGGAQASTEKAQ